MTCGIYKINSILSQSHFSCTLLEYKDFEKGKKPTHLNEVTYMPSSGLPVLFDKEIQMQEEDSFIRFTSVAVTETFLASFLYRLIIFFFQNIDVSKKKKVIPVKADLRERRQRKNTEPVRTCSKSV